MLYCSCKCEGWSKIFEYQYIIQKLFIVCSSVKRTFLAYSCEQLVEVMSL